ncbi:MAG: AI-2E family transporter [Clostridia bacterium]|nr:AI-2E family transporter [Clostridia bacterium]
MQNEKKKAFDKNISLGNAVLLIIVAIVTAFTLMNFKTAVAVVGWLFRILSPFLIGLAIAFSVNILMTAFEDRVFTPLNRYKFWCKIKRIVCMLLSFIIIIAIITLLLLLIVPQLQKSLTTLAISLPGYITNLQATLNTTLDSYNMSLDDFKNIQIDWQSILKHATDFVKNLTPQVATIAGSITTGVFNFLMGIFFALYMLIGKEKILKNIRRTYLAFFGEKRTQRACEIVALSHRIFKNFIVGQLTEALILGVLYFIAASIFKMPYALLIAVIMAIGGIIPMFGPIIAAVPSTFILLMIDPASALVFVIMSIVIQQVESNFIYPFIVGDSIGLPAIWVLFSILVGGSVFGGVGMFLSVPIASVLYALLRENVNARLAPPAVVKEENPKEKPKEEK